VPVLKQVTAEITPFLTSLYNRSMISGVFPDRYKMAYITLILKKLGQVTTDARYYGRACRWIVLLFPLSNYYYYYYYIALLDSA